MPDSPKSDSELFFSALAATPDESAMMLCDLHRALKSLRNLSSASGIPLRSLNAWKSGGKTPSAGARRAIFLLWAMICRPGELKTVRDLETWGRLTERGNPATAGTGKLKRNLSRAYPVEGAKPAPKP